MLVPDPNKSLHWSPNTYLSPNTAAPFAMLRGLGGCCDDCNSGLGVWPDFEGAYGPPITGLGYGYPLYEGHLGPPISGMSGLGFVPPFDTVQDTATSIDPEQSILTAINQGLDFVPVVGNIATSVMSIFKQATARIAAGRREADVIVPLQNDMMNRLGQITNAILVGQSPTVDQLQGWYLEVWQLGLAFVEFVQQSQFRDRRASGQALNTVMPYLDGTCSYSVPLGRVAVAGARNCLTWGDGTLGGPGTNGMTGAIGRAIDAMGGLVPALAPIAEAGAQNVKPTSVTLQTLGIGGFSAQLQKYAPYLILGAVLFALPKIGKYQP